MQRVSQSDSSSQNSLIPGSPRIHPDLLTPSSSSVGGHSTSATCGSCSALGIGALSKTDFNECSSHQKSSSRRQSFYVRDSFRELQDLLNRSWIIHRVSPLCNYVESNVKLKQYSLQLKHFLGCSGNAGAVYRTHFCVLEDLKIEEHDSGTLQITVECSRNEKGFSVAYCGYLFSWDLNTKPLNDETVSFPLMLCRGTKYMRGLVNNSLCKIFDCKIYPYHLSPTELLWLNGIFATVSENRKKDENVTLCLSLPGSQNLPRIEVNIQLKSLHDIWKCIHQETLPTVLKVQEIWKFYDVILEHIKDIFPFYDFNQLLLTEVKYPGIGITKDGVIRSSSPEILDQLLWFLCSESCLIEDAVAPSCVGVESLK